MDELNTILEMTRDQSTQKEQDEVSTNTLLELFNLFSFSVFIPPQILLQPFAYIQEIPGKQFRSQLSLAFNYWLHIPDVKLQLIGEIVQMLHNSSLL